MEGRRSVWDYEFAAANETTAIKVTEHLIAGLKHWKVNRNENGQVQIGVDF